MAPARNVSTPRGHMISSLSLVGKTHVPFDFSHEMNIIFSLISRSTFALRLSSALIIEMDGGSALLLNMAF